MFVPDFFNSKKHPTFTALETLRTESFRKVTVNCQEIHLYRAGDPRAATVGKFDEYQCWLLIIIHGYS